LTGSNNADLIGNNFDNTLTGNAGNNVFVGDGGNDTIYGGAGNDTAVFSGIYSEYKITEADGAITVEDNQPQRDGSDNLKNIEILRFSDKEIKL
jgi:Ca2+-binding RTX toxin-like protein